MERIKIYLSTLLFLVGCSALTISMGSSTINSPIGYWKAVDTNTGKTKSIIQIWQAEDNTLHGKIVKVFPSKNFSLSSNQKHQVLLGQVILSGLVAHENQWNGGKIIDIEDGKKYQCSIHVAENGEKLNVIGYTIIPLLGHSQTWERVDLMSDF